MIGGERPAEAEAFFGSSARGDGDRFSDIDYLIVDDDHHVRHRRKLWLGKKGFSVSDFSWIRLERLVSQKTLFALHLKLESRVVCDTDGRLQDLLSRVSAKSSYKQEFERSLDLLRPIEQIPDSPLARAWAMDVLAVAYRNSAILKLACDGDYVFSHSKILQTLQKRGHIDNDDAVILAKLRQFKADYRNGKLFFCGQSSVDRAIKGVTKSLQADFSSEPGRASKILRSPSDSVDAYALMRQLEGVLISLPSEVSCLSEVRSKKTGLLRKLRDPHSYLWSFMHNEELAASIREVESWI